jgi:sugar lactone lactonase YvrE
MRRSLFVSFAICSALSACTTGRLQSNSPFEPSRPAIVRAAIASGTLYVANDYPASDSAVTVYPPGSNAPSRTISNGVEYPIALAMDRDNDLFVLSIGGNTVNQYPKRGTSPMRTIEGGKSPLLSIAVAPDNDLYVGQKLAIKAYRPGKTSFFRRLPAAVPVALTFDASGTLYVADYTDVRIYPPKTKKPSVTISQGIYDPSAIALDASGNIYLANGSRSGTSNIIVYDPSGSVVRTISQGVDRPTAMALDSTGTLYVGNSGSYSVTVYAPGSESPERTITQDIDGPNALAFDPQGNLYVANFYGGVTVYAPGQTSVLRTITKGVSYPHALLFTP